MKAPEIYRCEAVILMEAGIDKSPIPKTNI